MMELNNIPYKQTQVKTKQKPFYTFILTDEYSSHVIGTSVPILGHWNVGCPDKYVHMHMKCDGCIFTINNVTLKSPQP